MGHIKVKQNKITRRFRVLVVGDNGEKLSVSESLNSREAVVTNINAQNGVWDHPLDIRWEV